MHIYMYTHTHKDNYRRPAVAERITGVEDCIFAGTCSFANSMSGLSEAPGIICMVCMSVCMYAHCNYI